MAAVADRRSLSAIENQVKRENSTMNPIATSSHARQLMLMSVYFAGTFLAEAADGPRRVDLGTLAPAGSRYVQILQKMGERWKQAPGRALRLNIHPGGRLGGEADMVRLLRDNTLQAGMFTTVGLSILEPGVAGLQTFPMAFRTLEEFDHINEQLRPMLEKRLLDQGVVVLFWVDAGWVRYFSTTPMLKPDELKERKVFAWAGNTEQVGIMRRAGYNPVPLETADIPTSLQHGLIDALAVPPIFALSTQLYRSAPHMLELNWAPLVGATVIKRMTWEGLAEETRQALRAAAAEAGQEMKAGSRKENLDAVQAMEERGLKVHKVSAELEAQWRQAAEKVYPDIRGRMVPADVFDEVMRLLKEYRAR